MTTKTAATWQEELANECQKKGFSAPTYDTISDQRGGRMVFKASVKFDNRNLDGRWWYDQDRINDAKEDAAEVALISVRPSVASLQKGEPDNRSEAEIYRARIHAISEWERFEEERRQRRF